MRSLSFSPAQIPGGWGECVITSCKHVSRTGQSYMQTCVALRPAEESGGSNHVLGERVSWLQQARGQLCEGTM